MTLDEQIHILEQDLAGKLHRRDWHGVSDAANDLRELERERNVRRELEPKIPDARPWFPLRHEYLGQSLPGIADHNGQNPSAQSAADDPGSSE